MQQLAFSMRSLVGNSCHFKCQSLQCNLKSNILCFALLLNYLPCLIEWIRL